jgi:folate-binding protein YgfZ
MESLLLHQFHEALGAEFREERGEEVVAHYGQPLLEHAALREAVGLLDLSFRGRLCLTGADRHRFLHGQVTNDVNGLKVGEGCYAALITAKGKMISDLNIYRMENELLLDFEPGLTESVRQRLEQYIIADDVQIIDVAPEYGLFSVQGPNSAEVLQRLPVGLELPATPMSFVSYKDPAFGELYVMNFPRLGSSGFDLNVPRGTLTELAQRLTFLAEREGGRLCGWDAFEMGRIEVGIPRFGVDMDESNLPLEAGLEDRAVSYTKGCYIGQEVIARIRTYGQVARTLRGLRLAEDPGALPKKGDKLFKDGKEVGFVTSALASPTFKANIALGYVRREANAPGTTLVVQTHMGESAARVVNLPFAENFA